MGKGTFSFLTGIILFYAVLGVLLSGLGFGSTLEDDIRYQSGMTETNITMNPPESALDAMSLFSTLFGIITFSIEGIPTWVQVVFFGPLDMAVIIAIGYVLRGING